MREPLEMEINVLFYWMHWIYENNEGIQEYFFKQTMSQSTLVQRMSVNIYKTKIMMTKTMFNRKNNFWTQDC